MEWMNFIPLRLGYNRWFIHSQLTWVPNTKTFGLNLSSDTDIRKKQCLAAYAYTNVYRLFVFANPEMGIPWPDVVNCFTVKESMKGGEG